VNCSGSIPVVAAVSTAATASSSRSDSGRSGWGEQAGDRDLLLSCRVADGDAGLESLATHRSYRATKSPLVTVGVDKDGGIGGEVLGCDSSQNRLAHVGAAWESTPSTPSEGEAWGE
jgi:hypothetical protein